jgi:hypothetical protein
MSEFLKEAIGLIVALATFFAFPAIQYLILRRFARVEGNPELWFLPAYGFRLVIRNIPGKKILSELKYRVRLRSIVPANTGATVSTLPDEVVIDREDFFLFPGTDQILISFRLERSPSGSENFVVTDKLGKEQKRFPLSSFETLICDYTANLENFLNFDIKIAKRGELKSATLSGFLSEVEQDPTEGVFELDRIRHVE